MSFASPFRSVSIPDTGLVSHLLSGLTPDDLQRRALVDHDSGEVLTYGQLSRAVDNFAALITADARAGDVAALMGPNSARWVIAYLGYLKAGVTVTPLTTLATAEEVGKQISHSNAVVVFTDSATATAARAGAEIAGLTSDRVRLLDDIDLYPDAVTPIPDRVTDPQSHIAAIPYSSGTTGVPKGVLLSHRNLVANVAQLDEAIGVDENSTVVGILPFAHIYGMSVVVNLSLRKRATIVTMRRFDLERFLSAIEAWRGTHLPVAPPVMVALGKSPLVDVYDLSSVRLILSGAAPLDSALAETVERRFGCAVRQAYGMTEMSPVSHIAPLADTTIPAASVGFAVPNMSCKLVDPENDTEIQQPTTGTSSPGELWCSGPNVMVGYLDNAQATAGALDDEGYLHTGDIAVVDAAGHVTIVDRLKELIKYKGYQVAPAELEGILLEHRQIADTAVVGHPLGNGDEAPHAFVVRAPGSNLTIDAVLEHVQSRVAPYKMIRKVSFVEVIPKSASGKILRRELRERL
ncbi:AMP-binding protein [Gordonia rhizosphera]|uniref:Putative 4-coumarate--CoA ligase n=1 Tax=Gordonia rhizosphera NBRC 16068 TaxID=1108045 RepID=K6WK98_9ACTN|nr:AMP-binding protein [Gordonia rhizosphera]GAB92587.1 putative 4-coumarate--CoA ligase [Gordonia rhizosphera NBRC 16068]